MNEADKIRIDCPCCDEEISVSVHDSYDPVEPHKNAELSFPDHPVEPRKNIETVIRKVDEYTKARTTFSHGGFGPVAMPNADNVQAKKEKLVSQAHAYARACKAEHKHIDVRDLETFKKYNVDWFSVSYNPQGYLEVDFIVFKDNSSYGKKDGIDMTFMGS
jgi:hypothetical protein